jgi:2-desacetyl-2-hydroxyethyl bacteriochlorophyllide A dehydrogenase
VRCAVFKGIGQPVAIERLPDPTPRPDEAILRVGRCGICGSDIHYTDTPGFSYPIGMPMGHEFAGEVIALGKNVTTLRIGDRVAAMPVAGCGDCADCRLGNPYWCDNWRAQTGGFGEYIAADFRTVVRLPESLSLADGALVEPLATGHHAVSMAALRHDSRVLVLGVGSIGLAAVFWARRHGAMRIAAAARSHRSEHLASELGASAFINTLEPDFDARVIDHLGGAPDVVFEATGARGLLQKATDCVRRRGSVIALGLCTHPDTWVPGHAMNKEITLQFTAAYSLADFHCCVDVLDAGAVEPRAMITQTISLDEFPATLEGLRRQHNQCKVQVDPWL